MTERQVIEEPEPLSPHPVVPIRNDIGYHDRFDQPASSETVEEIIEVVKDLTPPPIEGNDPYVFHRGRTILHPEIGSVVVGQRGLFDKKNPHARAYYEKIKNNDIVSVAIHPSLHTETKDTLESLAGSYSVDYSDETGYKVKKRAYEKIVTSGPEEASRLTVASETGQEFYLETVRIMDEQAAIALLGL